MKIAILGSAYPLRGGLAAYNERLCLECVRKGHDAEIWSFSLQYPNILFPGKSQYSDGPPPKDISVYTKVNSINPLNWISIGKQMRKEKFDLVIVKFWLPFMGPAFGTILRSLKKGNDTKVISILDNIIPHESRIGDKPFTNYFIKPVDAFVAMSQSVMDDLGTFDTIKPRELILHPLYDNFGDPISKDAAIKELGLDPDYKYLLFFGFIRGYKGLDLLLKAMADPKIKEQKIKVIIAGEFYEDEAPYRELIKELDLEGQIIDATEFIPDDKVPAYFCAADIVVQPYKDATQSGVTQIAYFYEKPMIVTNVGGLPEMIPHEKVGYVVEVDEREISKAILRFYDEQAAEQFAPHIKAEKERYSWSAMFDKVLDLYHQI